MAERRRGTRWQSDPELVHQSGHEGAAAFTFASPIHLSTYFKISTAFPVSLSLSSTLWIPIASNANPSLVVRSAKSGVSRTKASSNTGGGGSNGQWRFYSEDSQGLKVYGFPSSLVHPPPRPPCHSPCWCVRLPKRPAIRPCASWVHVDECAVGWLCGVGCPSAREHWESVHFLQASPPLALAFSFRLDSHTCKSWKLAEDQYRCWL